MSVKSNRHEAIRRILAEHNVRSQEELGDFLRVSGFPTTQATLSRDFKELGIVKAHESSKGYVYRLPRRQSRVFMSQADGTMTDEGIRSIEFSNSFAVIKTYPGFASAVATIIDNNLGHEIAGTLAGDDTLLLILREGCSSKEVLNSISKFVTGIQSKLI